MQKFIFIKKYCAQEFITIINKIHKSIYSNIIHLFEDILFNNNITVLFKTTKHNFILHIDL